MLLKYHPHADVSGDPKGVIQTNKNVLASAAGLEHGSACNSVGMVFLRSDDVYISYLPLPHSFEAMMQVRSALCFPSVSDRKGRARSTRTKP